MKIVWIAQRQLDELHDPREQDSEIRNKTRHEFLIRRMKTWPRGLLFWTRDRTRLEFLLLEF